MDNLHMKVGPLTGKILLAIAQDHLANCDVDKAINVLTDSLVGFTKENAITVLKNEYVLVVDEDEQTIGMSNDNDIIQANAHLIYPWQTIIADKLQDLKFIVADIKTVITDFYKYYSGCIDNYDMIEMMHRYFTDEELKNISMHTLAARIIGSSDNKICNTCLSNPQQAWDTFEQKIKSYIENNKTASGYQMVLYYTVQYNKLIKKLHKSFIKFDNLYNFLLENKFIEHLNMVEITIEDVLHDLVCFSDTNKKYNHPACDEYLIKYRKELLTDIHNTKFGNEYLENKILKKNIMDGYDAGYLSPEGDFYGKNGDENNLLHLAIADDIFASSTKYAKQMKNDGVAYFSDSDDFCYPDMWLEKHGWLKIHYDEVYGCFIGSKNPNEHTKDFPYLYAPTEIQIKIICDYIDKFYKGNFYTNASYCRQKDDRGTTTYKVRQMDEIMLHQTFKNF